MGKVGLFFYVRGRLLVHTCELNEAEDYGEFKDFGKGKAINTMIHNYCFNQISQQSALFCKSQQGFRFVRSDKVKQKRDNCIFIDDNP